MTDKTTPQMTDAQRLSLQQVKGNVGKKVLWWTLGILGVIGVIVTVVLLFLPKKNDRNIVERIIDKTKLETDKADIEAKIKVAEAKKVAAEKIHELKKTMEIEDTNERRSKLAALL